MPALRIDLMLRTSNGNAGKRVALKQQPGEAYFLPCFSRFLATPSRTCPGAGPFGCL